MAPPVAPDEIPAEIETDPPDPLLPAPTVTDIPPPLPTLANEDWSVMAPLFPNAAAPVLSDNEPVCPALPEAEETKEIEPLEVWDAPLEMKTSPPVAVDDVMVAPACTYTKPPTPEFPEPTEITTEPARPEDATLVPITMAPELPLKDTPVLITNCPVDPLEPADVVTEISPLDVEVPAPD